MNDKQMTFIEHLTELRTRLLISIVSVLMFSIIGFVFANQIIRFLTQPLDNLVFLSPAEAFYTNIKVAVIGGFFLSLPIVLYQVWAFILSALKETEKRFLLIFLPCSWILFIVGTSFALFLVMPLALRFFIGFATPDVQPMISLNYYISFVLSLLIPFGLMFELPLVMALLVRLRLVHPRQIGKARRFIFLAIFVIGSLFTPPDVLSQMLLALPLLLLFEISLLISRIIAPKDL